MRTNPLDSPVMGSIERRWETEWLGTTVLVLAAVLAGASILTDGGVGRALNGAAALAWMAGCGVLLATALRAARMVRLPLLAALGLAGALAVLIRPADLVPVAVAFGVAGGLMALIVERRWTLWAVLVPALYLPLHIASAVTKAIVRSLSGAEASVRTEPPPTAALVPLAMILAALVGGWIVTLGRARLERNGLSRGRGPLEP